MRFHAIGEPVTSGPQVISQYWDNLVATGRGAGAGVNCTLAMWFHGCRGWFYVVDRSN